MKLAVNWMVFCLIVALLYCCYLRAPLWKSPETYICEGPGWMIRTTESELKRPALLVIGTLTDGRRVALPKAHIRECKVVAE